MPNSPQKSWNDYQMLVLDKLSKVDDLCELFALQRIEFGEFKVQLKNTSDLVAKLSDKIEQAEKKQTADYINLVKLKWQLGLYTTVASSIAVLLFQYVAKLIFKF